MREPKVADDVVAERLRAVLAGSPGGAQREVVGPRSRAEQATAVRPLADLAQVGEPLEWSDIIAGWLDDAPASSSEPDPAAPSLSRSAGPAASREPSPGVTAVSRWAGDEFPVGSAWASPPATVPAAALPATSSHGVDLSPAATRPDYTAADLRAARRSPDQRKPLAPPAWVLPETEPDEGPEAEPMEAVAVDPLERLGFSESWAAASPEMGEGRVVRDDEYEESGLSAAGAFGGGRDDGKRRMGLRAFDPERRGVRALVAVVLLVIVVAGFLAWRARPRVDPVVAPSFDAGSGTGAAGAGPASAAVSASVPAEVVVAVAGKVRKPGLVRLPPGARVADALTAAGGAEAGVDVSMLNLARKVVDGELILVGVAPSPGSTLPAPPAGAAATTGGLVNLNTATLADLDTLPGVGPVLAQRILDARTAQGGFRAVGDLRKVSGIGDARYEQLKDLVTV